MVDIYSQLQDLNRRMEQLESNLRPPILRTYKYIYTAEIAEDPNFSLDNRLAHHFSIAAGDLPKALAGLRRIYADDRILSIKRRDA
jgi:hypothetical protein